METKHLYSVLLKNEGGITTEDHRDLDEFTAFLKSGEATLINGELNVNPDDLISVKEIPNVNSRHVG